MHVYPHKQNKKKQKYNDFLSEEIFWETFISMFILHYSSQSVLLILLSISILLLLYTCRVVKRVIFTEHFCEPRT